ncbi:MAG: CDP-alcohol phosphatidyltransferase family protein [Bacilli bacterium]|nr:CDP-alcohol phosphatidyltransferase family protein [Bacilli bacterium]
MKELIKKYWFQLSNGTNTMFKEFFNKETNKKQRANMWTFSRLVTSFLIPICSLISILTSNFSLFIVSIGITGFGGITDFFDGRSARKYNSNSEFGKFLDQVADKIFSIMIGINVALFNPLFLLNLLGEGLIMAINIPYEVKHKNFKVSSSMTGKIKQWPLFFSLVLGFASVIVPALSTATNISILITFLFQLATVASYIKNNNNEIKLLKETETKNNLIEIEEDFDKTKSLEKTIGENTNSINKKTSKKDLYIGLRDLLKDIEVVKPEKSNNNYQKRKK